MRGSSYPEVIQLRDETIVHTGVQLAVSGAENSIKKGTAALCREIDSRNAVQAVTLVETIEEQGFDALIGDAWHGEKKAWARERIFSFCDKFGQQDPKSQHPELWSLYNIRLFSGEDMRVFPISNWMELDIQQYIARESLALPSIYYSHKREVVEHGGLLVSVIPLTPRHEGKASQIRDVRFCTVGGISYTCSIAGAAATLEDIITETVMTTISERSVMRIDDRVSEVTMEERKKTGYF